MKVKLPVVLTDKLVNVFPLIFTLKPGAVFNIPVMADALATVCVKATKLLLLILMVDVALIVEVSTKTPCSTAVAEVLPDFREIVLLDTLLV